MVSVIVCAKNESSGISEVIAACLPYCDELIVIDGHSEDGTRELAEKAGALVYLDSAKGKGDGIRTGINVAKGDVLVFIDADLSHEACDIPTLVKPISENQCDMVVASRKLGGSDELHGSLSEFIRLIGSGIITLSINYRFGVRLTDSQNGFRAIKRSVAKDLHLTEDIFTIEQEMIMKALKKGYQIQEVPSHEFKRKYGDSQIIIHRVAHRYIWTLFKYLF
jgi:glycosyltransferase involved in cell wall biosynthesis